MSLLDLFRTNKKNSANVAKERLQIIVAHQRSTLGTHRDRNIQALKQKLTAVITEFLNIDESKITVELERDNDRSVLELNVTLPDDA